MASPEEPVLSAVRDHDRGRRNLAALAAHLGPGLAARLLPPLADTLPRVADPDMALNNLERLLAQPAARSHLPPLLDHHAHGLLAVLQLLATSQFFADTLALDPDFLPAVPHPPRRSPSTAELTAQLRAKVDAAPDDAAVLRAFRWFRARHALRVGANDIVRDRPLDEVTRELARVADASVEVALAHALRTTAAKLGQPTAPDGRPARVAVFAFGKLGGDELNYSSDIDLMVVYDHDGQAAGRRSSVGNDEAFARVVRELVRLLSAVTDRGAAYRVDLRLRPDGGRGPLARSLAATLSYYDTRGRTWERQALIKLRHVAGDPALGREFLRAVEPFVYRKYFSFAEINEVKALKRQMEHRAAAAGDIVDVKTGRGGIRDIEYAVQFLQLLNGGDLPAVRQRNTLLALEALEIAGCLTPHETYVLSDAYRFLRKVEHRVQLLFDLQTHRLPAAPDDLRTLARRMGYSEREPVPLPGTAGVPPAPDRGAVGTATPAETLTPTAPRSGAGGTPAVPGKADPPLAPQKRSPLDEAPAPPALDARDLLVDPLDQFLHDLHDKTAVDRAVLDHLLHQTFPDAGGAADPEADLILDPNPDDAAVRAALGRYGFRDVPTAYQNLLGLARESVPFLSDRRCRHFFASIAPALLRAVADTPDPDDALTRLERVSASLGAKAVLWELFSANPATLKLYVELCAGSPFLSAILTTNPGMADELLDSLVLNRPRSAAELRAELAELCRGAGDTDPILHSFQDKELLRVGVADLLGKAGVRETTAALADLADTVLNQVFDLAEAEVRGRSGTPAARYAVVGLGKLGGREISYHSDLDLLLVYEADGATAGGRCPVPHAQFFTDLARRVIRTLATLGPMGKLYAVDMRLRPTGKSGSLVFPLCEFVRYFGSPAAGCWERQALCRARVLRGEPAFADAVTAAARAAALGGGWSAGVADEVRSMRAKLEAGPTARNLKRGPGGVADVEFLVQLLQLRYGRQHPDVLRPNTWEALDALEAAGLLPADDAAALRDGYTFLRHVTARLRVVTDRPLNELPADPAEVAKLARRLGYADPAGFLAEVRRVTADLRRRFDLLTANARG